MPGTDTGWVTVRHSKPARGSGEVSSSAFAFVHPTLEFLQSSIIPIGTMEWHSGSLYGIIAFQVGYSWIRQTRASALRLLIL